MKLNDFINKNLNKKIDYDKVFGSQCVDVFRQYCEDVLNIPHTGSVEGAKDLYLNYEKLPLEQKYFKKLSCSKLKYGDVVIWNKTATNEYGHIAIFIGHISDDGILVIEQNGFNQQGLKFEIKSLRNNLGILRFKGVVS